MSFANNRAAPRPRANFMTAGGTTFLFKHPSLSFQIGEADRAEGSIDEIDVSRALQLNATFFDARPMQDSAHMELLVDGSTITITNHSMAGTATLQVLPTTGLVGTGDFIAAAHIVIASKDSTGGVLTVIREVGGNRLITIYYGLSFKNVPHQIIAGNSVVPYPVTMNYGGWVQVLTSPEDAAKVIWAVGNELGIRGTYQPYGIQEGEVEGRPVSRDTTGVGYSDIHSPVTDNVPEEPNIDDAHGMQSFGIPPTEGPIG